MPDPQYSHTPQPHLDLALALRRATAGIHAEIERLPLMVRLNSETVTLEDYRYYLQAIVTIHAPLEGALYERLDAETLQRLNIQPKLPALLADLEEQGLEAQTHRIMAMPMLMLPESRGATVGGLYVLEGATLGGRTIARHLRRFIGESLGTSRFLDFHGQQTSAAWKGFTSALNGLSAEGVLTPDAVIAGALAVFTHVHTCLERIR
ncbi:biliverdin-producing heme oxygenase [Allochromatium palmeri]|uniref:Biliverdin-producing heme oxygenase n=1 Tax=Allochromatium palmeri TaxID=231048 RepID=A0A6N8EEN4_9GAMM|nr:biliverdin-producing heme oxygenase [Allochromatium palmeri]MTW20997.1 biliverdin-producing heme oxygenase [Allochromatium palmeri]